MFSFLVRLLQSLQQISIYNLLLFTTNNIHNYFDINTYISKKGDNKGDSKRNTGFINLEMEQG